MSLVSELKRRNVFKVGAAYAIVGWLMVQVADTFLGALNLPGWTVTLVAALVILGFPLALLLAWAYEMTPEGIKAATDVEPQESITHATGQKLNYGILALVVLAVGFLVVDQYVFQPGTEMVGSRQPVMTPAVQDAGKMKSSPISVNRIIPPVAIAIAVPRAALSETTRTAKNTSLS